MVVKTEPSTTPASTTGAAAPSDALCAMVSKSASLATKPRNGGSAAMLAVAKAAMTNSGRHSWPSQASRRMSRVPVEWSMTPTTMNSVALNSACAKSMARPASIRSRPPPPTITVMKPSWLTVPNARISLRSYSRTARQPASSMVATPSVMTVGRQRGEVGEAGGQPGDEVDAGLDHRGGVQVRADRGRGGHGAGQPEVERHHGRLADRADEHQRQADAAGRSGRRVGHQFGQQVGAGGVAEDDDADQHRQPAGGGDQQGLHGGAAAGGALGVVPDEQERQHRRQLPERVEQQHVVADHQAEHRPGERDEFRGEAGQPVLGVAVAVVEVLGAVEQHQRADAQHQHAHDRRAACRSAGRCSSTARAPTAVNGVDAAGVGPVECHPDQRRRRDDGQRVEGQPSPSVDQHGRAPRPRSRARSG